MRLRELKKREKELRQAHEEISKTIEQLLDHRIKIAGALEENVYMQKKLDKKEK